MLEALQSFITELRSRGLSVSPAEAVDAARAADAVGPEKRARFRAALSATLAKDLRARGVFDAAFEAFFVAPARAARGPRSGEAGGSGTGVSMGPGAGPGQAMRARPESEPTPGVPRQPGPLGPPRTDRASHRGVVTPPARSGQRGLRSLRPEEIRRELGKAPPREFHPKGSKSRPETGRDARPGAPSRPRLGKVLAADLVAGESRDARRRGFTEPLTMEEERRLAAEVPRIIDEIRLRRSRRRRRAARGRLFMKRVIRENLASGGVPFRIPHQLQRRKRPRVVLLIDVSWSVARAAGLFLMMALEFLKPERRASIFFFVDRPLEVTGILRKWLRGGSAAAGRSFLDVLSALPDLNPDAASDYGRAFFSLAAGPLRKLDRDTVLVVLGDGRTNVFDPLPWAFEEITGRTRRALWLVPEARARWGTGDSALPRYLPFCDVAVETTDLDGLARGVREILSSI